MNEEEREKPQINGLAELEKLNAQYIKKFWELHENKSALAGGPYEKMKEALHKQYMRDYELLDGKEGVETDKQIEELKIERDKEIEGIKHEHEKQLLEFKIQQDKELEAIKLEHEKVLAGIKRERERQNNEIAVLSAVQEEENDIKKGEIVPDNLPKRWWQLHARPNYARQLAQREAQININKYFAERENIIERAESITTAEVLFEELLAVTPMPKRKRKRLRVENELRCRAEQLALKWQRIEEANEQLNEIIRAADEATSTETFEEPQAEPKEQEQPKKPKRVRTRKTDAKEQEETAEQASIDELGQSGKPEAGAG